LRCIWSITCLCHCAEYIQTLCCFNASSNSIPRELCNLLELKISTSSRLQGYKLFFCQGHLPSAACLSLRSLHPRGCKATSYFLPGPSPFCCLLISERTPLYPPPTSTAHCFYSSRRLPALLLSTDAARGGAGHEQAHPRTQFAHGWFTT
jgi:hypothetical protein